MVVATTDALNAWCRGELKSYNKTWNEIQKIDRDILRHWEKRTKEDMEAIALLSERREELISHNAGGDEQKPREVRGWQEICALIGVKGRKTARRILQQRNLLDYLNYDKRRPVLKIRDYRIASMQIHAKDYVKL